MRQQTTRRCQRGGEAADAGAGGVREGWGLGCAVSLSGWEGSLPCGSDSLRMVPSATSRAQELSVLGSGPCSGLDCARTRPCWFLALGLPLFPHGGNTIRRRSVAATAHAVPNSTDLPLPAVRPPTARRLDEPDRGKQMEEAGAIKHVKTCKKGPSEKAFESIG